MSGRSVSKQRLRVKKALSNPWHMRYNNTKTKHLKKTVMVKKVGEMKTLKKAIVKSVVK